MSAVAGAGLRVGIDLLEIERLERALERTPRLAERLFTEGERAYAASQGRPGQHLAAALPDSRNAGGPPVPITSTSWKFHDRIPSALAAASLAQKRAARCCPGRP